MGETLGPKTSDSFSSPRPLHEGPEDLSLKLQESSKISQSPLGQGKDTLSVYDKQEQSQLNIVSEISLHSDRPLLTHPQPPSVNLAAESQSSYYDGSMMASVFIVLSEIMRLSSDLRAYQDEIRREMSLTKYESAIVSADLRQAIKMNQAFQSFINAMGSATEATLGAIQTVRSTYTEVEAKKAYDTKVQADKTQIQTDTEALQQKLPAIVRNPPAAPADNAAVFDQREPFKDYKARVEAELVNNPPQDPQTVRDIRSGLQALEASEKKLSSTTSNAHNIIAAEKQVIDGTIQLFAQTIKSMVNSITQSAVGITQALAAELEREQAKQDATTESLGSSLQLQEQAVQQARSAVDEIKRTLEQMVQSYNSALASRA